MSSTELVRALSGPVLEVAPRLLGARLRHGGVVVRVSEVEAYDGVADPGSHAFRGRTPRNGSMFGPPGRLYTYFVYGMHWCANVVTGAEGEASAVLLRAGEVVDGLALARERRCGSSDRDLARGPARLCRALDIGRDQDGLDLSDHLELATPVAPDEVSTGPRVGLRLAADRPWRFWLGEEPTVSAYRSAATRSRRE